MLGIGAFPGSSEPQLVDHPSPPAPGDGQVLCQTIELGVCGTDRDILESTLPLIPSGESHLVLGHECLGRIVEVGRNVSEFSPGDLVVPVVRRAFDQSHLRPDMLPFGVFTERGIVREHGFSFPFWLDQPRYLFRVSEEIADVAVLTEPLSVAEKGINEARRNPTWATRALCLDGRPPAGPGYGTRADCIRLRVGLPLLRLAHRSIRA